MTELLMPAEWEPHESCMLAWPPYESLWGESFASVEREHAAIVRAIAAFEPVTVLVLPGQAERVRALCEVEVTTVEIPMDDAWLRATGPIVVHGPRGRVGVDFRYNSFGERFHPYARDDRITERLLPVLGIERRATMTVLEGGAISVDGQGTLIATEQCVLNANRNPRLGRADIEAEFRALLGAAKVIWLPYGHLAGDTDGHVDHVCQFTAPGRVLVESCGDASRPDHARLKANRAVLEASTDAAGRRLEILELPPQQQVRIHGQDAVVNYMNFYIANGGVIMPLAGTSTDDEARAAAAAAFPGHRVVGVEARALATGDGGIHCVTQQLPARRTQEG
ncbi:agmatine deiminase family protein [Streptomyces sp. A3M-1-3]|uniref:agmatine deiminase family protein n=1 Tax=Streptomyces sp. A3M-1-3 TaxID=2962044 RepID=UPI0020B65A58|nr:agmatine deiminase family protein [Streptomyces sp. A3M-1-3]MCP3820237.1 agmatine deiminase family protein [Streptomyces sp. A3M-1-3]